MVNPYPSPLLSQDCDDCGPRYESTSSLYTTQSELNSPYSFTSSPSPLLVTSQPAPPPSAAPVPTPPPEGGTATDAIPEGGTATDVTIPVGGTATDGIPEGGTATDSVIPVGGTATDSAIPEGAQGGAAGTQGGQRDTGGGQGVTGGAQSDGSTFPTLADLNPGDLTPVDATFFGATPVGTTTGGDATDEATHDGTAQGGAPPGGTSLDGTPLGGTVPGEITLAEATQLEEPKDPTTGPRDPQPKDPRTGLGSTKLAVGGGPNKFDDGPGDFHVILGGALALAACVVLTCCALFAWQTCIAKQWGKQTAKENEVRIYNTIYILYITYNLFMRDSMKISITLAHEETKP